MCGMCVYFVIFAIGGFLKVVELDVPTLLYCLLNFIYLLALAAILIYRNYKIRQYPEFIKFEGDMVKISYLNKGMFRLNTFKGKIEDCVIKPYQEDYIIVNGEKIIALIKTDELNEDEISFLKEKFQVSEM